MWQPAAVHARSSRRNGCFAPRWAKQPFRVNKIRIAMPYLIDRVMGEASLYDEDIAALALAQPVQQNALFTHRRISAAFKDISGITREPMLFPSKRAHTLQSLARADTGGTLALGNAAMRGYGKPHPTVNELRLAVAEVMVKHPKGSAFSAGRVKVSQAEVVSKSGGKLSLGFAATLGWNEVKCISAATLDLNSKGAAKGSATEEEFFLYHTEEVESSGFCIHFKLPHYVTF